MDSSEIKISNSNYLDYNEPAQCPYCQNDKCYADFVDVGIGMQQCGPYYCDNCGACQIGPHDTETELSENEKRTHWYEPGREHLTSAPTVAGKLVRSHEEAMFLYELGLLDLK